MNTFTKTILDHDALVLALAKHGLPTYGSDAELQTRYDRNNLGKLTVAAKPVVHAQAKDGNVLLANRAAVQDAPDVDAPSGVEVTSENVHEEQPIAEHPTLGVFGPRKPGRPPKQN